MRRKCLYLSVLFLLFLSACAKKTGPGDEVLFKVSNQKITVADLNARIAKLPPYYQNIIAKDKKRFIDDLIFEMLSYEEGIRRGLGRDKEVKEVVEEAKKKIVIAKLIKNEVEDKITVTDDDMKKFYEEHKSELKMPDMWRASHILVSDENTAKAILDELAKGAKFEDLAGKYSIDPTASRGGDVGFFREGQLVPEFEKTAMKLEIGQTSGIIKTRFGYHIIKLTDKRPGGVQSYDDAKKAIEARLRKAKRSELMNKFVMNLKDKYGVEIREDVFKAMDKESAAKPAGAQ